MADKPTTKSKRQVKNPDSFRERAQKAAETSGQPTRAGKLRSQTAKPFKPAARVIGRSLAWKIVGTVWLVLKKVLRFLVPRYFRNSWVELRQVTWPGLKLSRQLTSAVLIFAIVFGASIALVDYGLDKLFRNILLK